MTNQGEHHQKNAFHKNLLQGLNRISGQLEGIKKMIQEERYCPEILTQLHASRSALRSLEIQMLDNHLSCCVLQAFEEKNKKHQKQKIDEIRLIMKRFN